MWRDVFSRLAPQIRFCGWPDWNPSDHAEYALVWQPPRGELARHSSLKAIFSLGAGVDHLSSDPDLPSKVPVIRMVDPTLTTGMSEFVVLNVLYHHRAMTTYSNQQRHGIWQVHEPVPSSARSVGIMGVGVLGLDALKKLRPFRFELRGWSQSPKQLDGITHFAGSERLSDFLDRLDILVCLLPLTPATRGILNHRTFSHLATGAAIISVGRGEHLIDSDLMAALDSGQIGAASIDVFNEEPLPRDHLFWHHPHVLLTPHIASMTSPATAAPGVLEQIWNQQNSKPFSNIVDMTRGY